MTRTLRYAAYVLAAASLAACSSSPMGPDGAVKCDPRSGECAAKNFVNPHVNFVNPHVNFVNPHVNFVNPHV